MKIYILLTLSFLILSCNKSEESKRLNTIKQNLDTILSSKPNGYIPFNYESNTIPIISFSSPSNPASAYEFPKKDSIYTIRCELVGFKNRDKTYPLKIVSDDLEIINRDSIQKTYTFKFIKDTAIVDCFLECQYKNVVYWQNDLNPNIYTVLDKQTKIGHVDLFITKKRTHNNR